MLRCNVHNNFLLALLQSLLNSLVKQSELYFELLLGNFAELEKAHRAPLLQLAIPKQHVYFSQPTSHVRNLLVSIIWRIRMASVLRCIRFRTVASYKILKNISTRQTSTYWFGYIYSKSTPCLNNPHYQFCSKVTRRAPTCSAVPARTLTYYSRRKGKRKTVKAVVRRFRRTGSGKWKRWQAGKNHFNSKKTSKRKSRLRRYVICNKQQTKLLNKMVNGW